VYAYVSRNGRWNSPKYLIGESYGTTRSAVLVNRLQSREGMDFNGVVLISSILDFETTSFAPGHDISYVMYLPSYAATAAYHRLIPQPADLAAFLDEVRRFAVNEYADALNKGSALGGEEAAAVRRRLVAYTGLSDEYLTRANLRVSLRQWMAELNRARGQNTGRLDSRFTGPMLNLLAEGGEGDPQSRAITGAYTAAINAYLRDERDLRGLEPRVGWIHATAHTADLLKFLARDGRLRPADQARLLDAAWAKMAAWAFWARSFSRRSSNALAMFA
jgi:carboxypeptidase C (cathepsin A)